MNRTLLRSLGLVLACGAAAACGDSTGPEGSPTDLTVRAYVDADGSGGFSTGDAPIAGAEVMAVFPDGGTAATAQTNAQGEAVFPGLRPGRYTLSLAGTAPAGAVLTSATEPVVVASALGGAAQAEFRFANLPGTLAGSLYRDDNGNGQFDAGDLPAPGVQVRLFAGGAATGDAVATTSTTAAGAFSFGALRPGTYTLEFVPPRGITLVGGATQTVTVGAAQPLNVGVRFTGSFRVPIAEAEARPLGSVVTVSGVITVAQGAFRTDNVYLQDATGGILVMRLPTDLGLQTGDSVEVTGGLRSPFGELQIDTANGQAPTVLKLGTGTVPAPRGITAAQMLARTFEGELARVSGLTIVSVGSQSSATSSFNVTARTPDGTQIVIRVEGRTDVERAAFVVGAEYDVAGVLSVFNNVAQLKPRSTADVVRSALLTVAEAKGLAAGAQVTVTGVVTLGQNTFTVTSGGTSNLYIQDLSGGIQVFGLPADAGYAIGDSLRVTGTLGVFGGEQQITTPGVSAVRVGTGTVPAPRLLAGAELLARAGEGQLVRVNDVVVTAVASQSTPTSSFNVTARAPDGTVFTVRVEGRTDLERAAFTVGSTYDIVGIASVFSGNGQLKPRRAADLIPS